MIFFYFCFFCPGRCVCSCSQQQQQQQQEQQQQQQQQQRKCQEEKEASWSAKGSASSGCSGQGFVLCYLFKWFVKFFFLLTQIRTMQAAKTAARWRKQRSRRKRKSQNSLAKVCDKKSKAIFNLICLCRWFACGNCAQKCRKGLWQEKFSLCYPISDFPYCFFAIVKDSLSLFLFYFPVPNRKWLSTRFLLLLQTNLTAKRRRSRKWRKQ